MALDDASHSCIAVAGRGTRFLTHPHSLLLALVQVAVVANTHDTLAIYFVAGGGRPAGAGWAVWILSKEDLRP